MSIVTTKTIKRTINFASAFVIAVSTLTASMPFIFSQNANAAAPTNTTVANLAATVTAASAGDVINVTDSGTISSQIIINKPLTITSDVGSEITVAEGINAFGIQANDVTIEHFHFVGPYDFGEGAVTRALVVSPSVQDLTVQFNTFSHVRQPAYIDENVTGTIFANYADNTKGWVVLTNSDLTFTSNTFGDNVIDIALIAGPSNNYTDAEVVAISDSNDDAVVENQFGPTKRLSDSYVQIGATGRSGDEGTKWNPYAGANKIQSGVDRVVLGGTVHVAAGSYDPANLNKAGIIVKGAQAGNTGVGRVHHTISESLIIGTAIYSPSFNVTANNVTVDGFNFGPTVDGVASGPVGVDLGATSGAVVKNSVFLHNQRGISLAGASNVQLLNNQISYNNANPENNAGIWGDNVNGLLIQNSYFEGASNTAINLAGSQDLTVRGNTFVDNGNTAVIWQDQDVAFSNNVGSGFNGSGLFITGSDSVTVENNELSDGAAFNGISISTASGTPSSNISISNNSITGFNNGINIAAASALSDVLDAQNNDLSGNANAGINAPSAVATIVNAPLNWWGHASGPADTDATDGSTPADNVAGTGSAARGAVAYGPWCTLADCSTDSDDPVTPPVDNGGNGGNNNGGNNESDDNDDDEDKDNGPVAFTTPIITNPGSVLGNETEGGDTDTAGATDDKTNTEQQKGFDGTIAGIAWYWWLLVLAILGGGSWWLVGWLRRRNDETSASK